MTDEQTKAAPAAGGEAEARPAPPQRQNTVKMTDEVVYQDPGCGKKCFDCACNTNEDMRARNAKAAEESLRGKCPGALQEGETVLQAYKFFQRKLLFTNKRILLKDGPPRKSPFDKSGFGGIPCTAYIHWRNVRKNYKFRTIPYSAVGGWCCETAGMMGRTTNIWIYTTMEDPDVQTLHVQFRKSGGDVLAMHRLLTQYALPKSDPFGAVDEVGEDVMPVAEEGTASKVFDFLKGDASQLSPEKCQQAMAHILHPQEKVQMAYKSGRDTTMLTTKRVLVVDKRGLTGRSIGYISLLWNRVRLFAVESAGGFLDDAELDLYLDIPAFSTYHQALSKNCDLAALQKFLVDVTCGLTTGDPPPISADANTASMGGEQKRTLPHWLMGEGSAGQIDATEADRLFRYGNMKEDGGAKVLQKSEVVEMAFKGRKDYTLFTSKRMIFCDNKSTFMGMGKKQNFTTIPYASISHFAVQTAGGWLDCDCELQIWTDASYIVDDKKTQKYGDHLIITAEKGYAYVQVDLKKDKVDLNSIHRYLSEKVLMATGGRGKITEGPPVAATTKMVKPAADEKSDLMSSFTKWCTDNAVAVNPETVDKQMHDNGMLQNDEKTMLAFASGRDMLLLTTKRVFRLDTKGWTGNRTQYLSIPYSSIRSFECATAGRFDSDGELMLELNGNWPLSKPDKKSITLAAGQSVDCTISQDLSSGSCDMTRVAQLLGDRIIANNGAIMGPEIPQTPPSKGDANAMIAWLNGRDMGQLDADACKTMTETFKSSPNIMMADEFVEMGFTGRSFWGTEKQFCLFTPHRVLAIEQRKSLFSGSKWYYKTIPWKWACGTYVDRQLGCCDTDQILQVDFHSVSTPQLTLKLEQDKCDLFQCTNYVQRKLDALTQQATAIKSSGKMTVQQNMKPEGEQSQATPAAAPENVVLEEKPGAEDKTNGESTTAPAAESA